MKGRDEEVISRSHKIWYQQNEEKYDIQRRNTSVTVVNKYVFRS